MRFTSKTTAAAILLLASGGFNTASADVPQGFIDALNDIFTQISQAFGIVDERISENDTDIDNLNNRVDNLASANPNFGGYSMAFSPDGAPKNAVVLQQVQLDGSVTYSVPSRYATSTEEISMNGVLTQRPFIANYAFVQTDDQGNVLFAGNFIEAPDTGDYINFNIEESEYDEFGNKTVIDDTIRELWPCGSAGGTLICIVEETLSATDTVIGHRPWSYVRVIGSGDPLRVNGMEFGDYRSETLLTSNYSRIRARGIGEVLRMFPDGRPDREVIWYRANGVEGGSLAGTPFDAGQPFAGVFF